MKKLSLLTLSIFIFTACNASNQVSLQNTQQEIVQEEIPEQSPKISNILIPHDASQLLLVTTAN